MENFKFNLVKIDGRNIHKFHVKMLEGTSCAKCEKGIGNVKGCFIATNVPDTWYCGPIIWCKMCSTTTPKEQLEKQAV